MGKRTKARHLPPGNYNRANSGYSHCFCILGVKITYISSIVQALPCLLNKEKLA